MTRVPISRWVRLIRYSITGAITTGIDLLVLYTCVELFSTSVAFGKGMGFIVAVIFSFFVNKLWTFEHSKKTNNALDTVLFLKFLFVSCIGLLISLGCVQFFHEILNIQYLVSGLLTSAIVVVWNFTANSLWTFAQKPTEDTVGPLLPNPQHFDYELSIIIPAYNEEKRLPSTLFSAFSYFSSLHISFEVIVVDDGSSDNTKAEVKKILHFPHKIITLPVNTGKGAAVAYGVMESQGRYILFCDSDEATPFSEYKHLREAMLFSHIAIGSRYKNRSTVQKKQPLYRTIISRIVNFLTQIFLLDGITDTQCGFKLFRSEVGKQLFSLQKIHRFAFDVEFLLLARRFNFRVVELPVAWHDKEGSTVSGIRDGFRVVKDFLRIKFYMMFGFYEGEEKKENNF